MCAKTVWVETETKERFKAAKRKLSDALDEDLNDNQVMEKLLDLFDHSFNNMGNSVATQTPEKKIISKEQGAKKKAANLKQFLKAEGTS